MFSDSRPLTHKRAACILLAALIVLLTACGGSNKPTGKSKATPTPIAHPASFKTDSCPSTLKNMPSCLTPHSMRVAYGMESLVEQGKDGTGETVVDIVSYGSPTLQQDMNIFDQQFGLPAITVQQLSPIGTAKFDPQNNDMVGWAEETTLDVEVIHAMAPGAKIIVLTSPVDETEGTIGLPQFLQLEQYAVNKHLGQIFSQSYVASEPTLADAKSRQFVSTYDAFYKQATTQDGWTILNGSGDHGATDFNNLAATTFSPTPIVNFPADDPWVTAVGGTTLLKSTSSVNEMAWTGSGGGFSSFFSEPDYQKQLPQSVQTELNGRRGLPDVAANADPFSAMAIYFEGQWIQVGGTSAATPTWAGIIAVADQMAGHPLGFINPALYKIAAAGKTASDFRDIVSGSNAFTQSGVSVQGYTAVSGWDPVTGNGAPIGEKLLPALIAADQG